MITETRGQHIRDGNGVAVVSEPFQAARHQQPGKGDADDLAGDHPEGLGADRVAHSGQPQQQPAAFAGCVGAEGDDPRAADFCPR